MNPEIRKAIIRAFDNRVVWMDSDLPIALAKSESIKENDTYRTIHMMKDAGELIPEGVHGALRLSLKAVESEAPREVRVKKYLVKYLSTHWLAVVATIISLIALFKK